MNIEAGVSEQREGFCVEKGKDISKNRYFLTWSLCTIT